MKLSISNIAWSHDHDTEMYEFLQNHKFSGLEIAPTRIFPDSPYTNLTQATEYAQMLKAKFDLTISSMQSIWYGRNENIFGTDRDRNILINYTRQAVNFAEAINCRNMVFGCPQNRKIPKREYWPIAIHFFREIGALAAEHGTAIAIEPIPSYYDTNFINTTEEAFSICREINSQGVKVNVDLGTSLFFGEGLNFINRNIDLVNHIHISEPRLAIIQKRDIHRHLKVLDYSKWFSIEMKNIRSIKAVKETIKYFEEILS
jgi:sugar phosphate isomerase/epimerase